MDPDLLDTMLTSQEEFLKKLDQEAVSFLNSKTPSADALKLKQELVASEHKRLEDLKGTKSQAISRFDAEIQRQTDRLKSLEKEIEEDKRNIPSQKATLAPQKKKVSAKAGRSRSATAKRPRAKKGSG